MNLLVKTELKEFMINRNNIKKDYKLKKRFIYKLENKSIKIMENLSILHKIFPHNLILFIKPQKRVLNTEN